MRRLVLNILIISFIIFIVFLSIGIFLLFYLVYNLLQTIQNYKEIVKLFMVFILPIPLSIYIAFINSSKIVVEIQQTRKSKIVAITFFILTTLLLLAVLKQYDRFSETKFRELRLFPIFLNTVITFAFSINHLSNQNLKISSILGGLLLGLAIYFFI